MRFQVLNEGPVGSEREPSPFLPDPDAAETAGCKAEAAAASWPPYPKRSASAIDVVLRKFSIWVWVKIKPPGIGPQVLVHASIYQGSILGFPVF